MTTDDLVKGIDAGTIFDVSVGFNATVWQCSICGNDIRNYRECSHIPGREYIVESKIEKCKVLVGEGGDGELLELSLVYAGACNRATIKSTFSADGVKEPVKGTNLYVVDNIKNIPMNTNIYQYYTKDGSVLLTDTEERTEGLEYINKRSEDNVNEALKLFNETFGLDLKDAAELSAKIKELATDMSASKDEVTTKLSEVTDLTTKLDTLTSDLSTVSAELEVTKTTLAEKDTLIGELTTANEDLTAKAGLADTYMSDLVKETIELGIKANGNAFQTDLFEKFLATLSIDEVKAARDGFQKDVDAKFSGATRVTEEDRALGDRLNKDVPSMDDEVEFRNYVADKAVEYSKENKVSITEATKIMYRKYSSEEGVS
jgi:hypothetical protein